MRGPKEQPPQSLQRQSTPGGCYVVAFSLADIIYGLKSTGKNPRLLVLVLSLSQIARFLMAMISNFLEKFQSFKCKSYATQQL
jgi:hypothetical protein